MKILIKNAIAVVEHVNTKELFSVKNNSILIDGNIISKIGFNLQDEADEVIDATGMIVYPGLVNTHHHLMQAFARNIPSAQKLELFDWLHIVFDVLAKVDEQFMYYTMMVSGGELLKYGCTTLFDHQYSYPHGQNIELIDSQFRGAKELGIRYICGRGGITRGAANGGLAPESIVETTDQFIRNTQKVIEKYKSNEKYAMQGVAVAPCSPFTVTEDAMVESAKLARAYNVRLHTHLCETMDEERFCLETYGMRPLDWAEKTGVIGADTWYAHGIHFNDEEIERLAATKTGVAHCPISNMKLSSGICRIADMLEKGVRIGLAVDGSASNDGSNMLEELRVSYLLHRLNSSNKAPDGRELLNIATLGGAEILGLDSFTGSLEVGKAADLFMIDIKKDADNVGAYDDPVSMLATVGYKKPVDLTMVNGKIVVRDGHLTGIDERAMADKAYSYYKRMLKRT
ncbi:Hydroxydechloroatrazine ethylaminohydrolase [bioreactor metagenome]|uniref:Hydroxydechloroatrazine ethylaminohydrolase n=1 Tax=bioreactor metagenome TaxID=1076179 RepID=A0A645AE56_9ZZZZ|nr:amidohydrolase family protein [Candidatus Metalachnospira sp.]